MSTETADEERERLTTRLNLIEEARKRLDWVRQDVARGDGSVSDLLQGVSKIQPIKARLDEIDREREQIALRLVDLAIGGVA
jgi:hypothetical protein